MNEILGYKTVQRWQYTKIEVGTIVPMYIASALVNQKSPLELIELYHMIASYCVNCNSQFA